MNKLSVFIYLLIIYDQECFMKKEPYNVNLYSKSHLHSELIKLICTKANINWQNL